MIKLFSKIETVTFCGSQEEGYAYPEISGYGKSLRVETYSSNKCDIENSVVVNIGEYSFLPSQLKSILEDVEKYVKAAKEFEEK